MTRNRIGSLRLTVLSGALGLLFVLATPALAQEGEAAPQSGTPAGIGIMILLIGLAAIGIVGASVAFPRMSGSGAAGAGDDDDELIPDDELQ